MGTGDRDCYEDLWERAWSRSSESPGASHRTRRRLLLGCLKRAYFPGASVLDVGCGSGLLLADIRRRFPGAGRLGGTDISDAALSLARAAVPEAQFFRSDLQAAPLPVGEPFDIVTCSEVLEHLRDWRAAIGHMAGALKAGGALIVSVPHSMRNWGPHDEAVHHLRRYEKAGLCEALVAKGLQPDHVFTWGSAVYDVYYRLLLNRVRAETTWKRKGWLVRQMQKLLYWSFFVDDAFKGIGMGRMLFAVARKPP